MPPDAEAEVLDPEVLDTATERSAAEESTGAVEEDAAADGQAEQGAGGEQDADEVVVTIGDDPGQAEEDEHARAPEWVRELRRSNREKDRRIRELEAKVSAPAAVDQVTTIGERPTLAQSDYDEERHAKALEDWYERKRKVDDAKRAREEAEAKAKANWQRRLDDFKASAAKLKVKDFEDAESSAQEALSIVQQGIIINGAENPALLVYALGRNPKKAKELASIDDPVKFAFAVAKLETQLKVTPRKTAPLPETRLRGSGPLSGTVDSNLDRLRAEAEKTGDYSKVVRYKQQQRLKQQQRA